MTRYPPINRTAQLEELYAEVPAIDCQGFCHTSCGPIDMSSAERTRIAAVGLHIPKGSLLEIGPIGPMDCPALTMLNRCAVYDIRPLICRLWGVTQRMPCTYGCRPERYLAEVEAYELIARAYEISGEHERAEMTRLATRPENAARIAEIRDGLALRAELQRRRRGRGRAR